MKLTDKVTLQPFIPDCDKRRLVESKDRIEKSLFIDPKAGQQYSE